MVQSKTRLDSALGIQMKAGLNPAWTSAVVKENHICVAAHRCSTFASSLLSRDLSDRSDHDASGRMKLGLAFAKTSSRCRKGALCDVKQ
jgi:hypothetical protein